MTVLVVKYAGAPVFWASMRQATVALSTAEAELTAQVEALVAGRACRALVELFEGPMVGVIYNDNNAALPIATGTSGSWRTRHLRIGPTP